MYFIRSNKNGFTLTELMITIIIIGIITAFGIPSYQRTVRRSRERDAIAGLEVIREAARLYNVRYEEYPAAFNNVGEINSGLQLNVIEQSGNTYRCVQQNLYRCIATNTDGWSAHFRINVSDGDVSCNTGTCPSL